MNASYGFPWWRSLFETFRPKSNLTVLEDSLGVKRWHPDCYFPRRRRKFVSLLGLSSMTSLVYCHEAKELLDAFAGTIRDLVRLHEEQFQSILGGDLDSTRFDDLIHMALERKHEAKYAYLDHLETHGCSKIDGTNKN